MALVFAGGFFIVLFGIPALLIAHDAVSRDDSPPSLTVAEAMEGLEEGKASPTVELTDLELDCDSQFAFDEAVHIRGHDAAGHEVLVRLSDRDSCRTVARSPVGWLLLPRERQRRALKMSEARREQVAFFYPDHEGSLLGALVPMLFVGAGVLAVVVGLRRRRRLIARWSDAELGHAPGRGPPEPKDASPPAVGSGLIDPILGVPVRLDESFVRSFGRQRRFFRRLRWVMIIGAACLMAWTLWVTIDRHQTWDQGLPAPQAELDGHRDDALLFLLHHTEAVVVYTDEAGNSHSGRVSNWSLLWEADLEHFEVRYRADDPSRFMVSTIIDQTPGTLLLAALVSLLMAALGWVSRHDGPRLSERQVRGLMQNLRTVELRVTNRFRETGANEEESLSEVFSFRARHPPLAFDVTFADSQPGPFFLDTAEQRALGLLNPASPEHVFVLREDLSPLAHPRPRAEDVREHWRQQVESRRAAKR